MVVKCIILMRHAEREDRAQEKKGIDWISTAPRPQDPVLSEEGATLINYEIHHLYLSFIFPYSGRKQAAEVGRQLKDVGITKILSSPMIRTVLTADIIAEVLGLGANSIGVEMGLVEEAKSFRGKTAAEPRPNWNPLILPVSDLQKYSDRIDPNYETIVHVEHVRDEAAPNTVREVHPSLTDRDEIMKDRCRMAVWKIIQSEKLNGEVVLCVGHGATVKNYTKALEAELPEEFHCKGDRTVSCYSAFKPFDENHPLGPWRSVSGEWKTGDIFHHAVDDAGDKA